MVILAGALIQPYFDYACGSWYNGVTMNLKHRLQTSQNKLIRLVLDLPMRTHLESSHFVDRVSQMQLCMVHRSVYGEVPNYFKNYGKRVLSLCWNYSLKQVTWPTQISQKHKQF